jgi:hypothetical protein
MLVRNTTTTKPFSPKGWGRLEMKPTRAEKQRQTKVKKGRVIKKPNRKRKKAIKTETQKGET